MVTYGWWRFVPVLNGSSQSCSSAVSVRIGTANEIAVEDGGAPQVRRNCERSMRQPDG